jgi:Flp pilus assembly CpaF family ATPase
MLDHVGRIVAAVGVLVTADLEAGYGDNADDVGRTVARAVELGAAGGNLEDARKGGVFGIDEAVDRLAAAPGRGAQRHLVVKADHLEDLVRLGTLTRGAAWLLAASVVAGLNILVAGGTQAGNPTTPQCTRCHATRAAPRRWRAP